MRQRILLAVLGVLILAFVPVYWGVFTGTGANDGSASGALASLLPSTPPTVPSTGGRDIATGPLLLKARDPDPERDDLEYGMLLREVVRQGILLAAREGMGLTTRDAVLREPFPNENEPRNLPLEVLSFIEKSGEVGIIIFRQSGNHWESLWTGGWKTTGDELYRSAVKHVEELSRRDFVEVLKKAGFRAVASPAPRASAPVPESVGALLDRLTIPAQFVALRALHAEIHEHGESPELLGALARAYAMMGVLTEWLWSPAHKAFKARALLYAQRGVNQWPQSIIALRHRALVRALVGFHRAALHDLATAAEMEKRGGEGVSIPYWAPLIEAYCTFDGKALEAAASDDSQAGFVRLLQLMAAEVSGNDYEVWRSAIVLAKTAPRCLRAIDGAASFRELGTHRLIAALGPTVTESALLDEMEQIPDLPPNVEECVHKVNKGRRVQRMSRALGMDPPRETTDRLQIIEELRKAVAVDRQEPSWRILAQLVAELDFMNAWRRIEITRMLCVPSDDEIDAVWRQVQDHPFALFIESFRSSDEKRMAAIQRLSRSLDTAELEIRESRLTQRIASLLRESTVRWNLIAFLHQDYVAGDLFACVQMVEGQSYPGLLRQTTPHMPYTIASTIRENGNLSPTDAEDIERQYPDSAAVQLALAKNYLKQNLEDDALRCFRSAGKLDPQQTTYEAMANLHLKRGDEEKWLATLEEFLTTDQFGLGHAQVRVVIANRFIEHRQWDKARPYAEAAAESYSGWGLEKAAQCAEAMQDWETAERYYAAESNRYPELAALHWYMFCKRTGQGDEVSALHFAREQLRHFDALGTPNVFGRGAIYWVTDKPAQAAEEFQRAYRAGGGSDVGIYAALALEEAGDPNGCQQMLRNVFENKGKGRSPIPLMWNCVLLAELLSRDLENGGKAEVDFDTIDQLVNELESPTERTVFRFAVGLYLDHHGQTERAIDIWKACVEDVNYSTWARTLTGFKLNAHGLSPESYKELFWATSTMPKKAKE